MRAFFLKDGRIRHVVMLPDTEDAIREAKALFDESPGKFDGFEVWRETRRVHRHGFPRHV